MDFWLEILGLVGFAIGYSVPFTWAIIALVCFILMLFRIKDEMAKAIIAELGKYLFIGIALGNGWTYYQTEPELVLTNSGTAQEHPKHYKVIDGVVYVKATDISETVEIKKIEKSTWENLKTWKPFAKEGE